LSIFGVRLSSSVVEEDSEDPELSEYLVRVRWIDSRDRTQAIWEKGMFANQNVVAKLCQPFTLQRLSEILDLDQSQADS